jgi:2-succinyl-5-enolpyruvyl-6-hydroxy-3-cyclohexene-1-carboxylate synthase
MPNGHAGTQEPANATYAYIGAFVDELCRAGIRHAVVCPGSRSTPLALALADQTDLRIWMHVDERSAAFLALGMAKRLCQPVALVCTSGTAAANFYPAIIEARLTHIPLLILTADRPAELRDCGAPQTIDQNQLYGRHVKWYMEISPPLATNEALRYIRTLAGRATALTLAVPAGPVHLNFPFSEPLTPEPGVLMPLTQRDSIAWNGRADGAPYISVSEASPVAPDIESRRLAHLLSATDRGLIIAGPQAGPDLVPPLLELACILRYPVLADPLSQLRVPEEDAHQATIISTYDAFLRSESGLEAESASSAYAPEVILRFGAMPVSKALLLYLERHASSCPHIVINGDGSWEEPTHMASEMIHADPVAFCKSLQLASTLHTRQANQHSSPTLTAWESLWRRTESLTRQSLLDACVSLPEIFEGRVFVELARLLPPDSTLVVGNSMPVRDFDTFFWGNGAGIRTFGNRGASGIDGVISTALGISAAREANERVVLVIGDLSFYHDANGLLAALIHHLDLTIILINNDGGGIFSFLPQAAYPEHFEELFGTPTGLSFQPLVEMYGGHFRRIRNWEEFDAALYSGWNSGGLQVIEVPTKRTANVLMHRDLWRSLGGALGRIDMVRAVSQGDAAP